LAADATLNVCLRDGEIVPRFLDASDHPWIALLIEEVRRFEHQPWRLLDERLRHPLPFAVPIHKRVLVLCVLTRRWRTQIQAAVRPSVARVELFTRAAQGNGDARVGRARDQTVVETAARLCISPAELEAALFADLASERILVPPEEPVAAADVALAANLMLVQNLLARAAWVRLRLSGHARAVVRYAKLKGLICTVAARQGDDTRLEISGPLALFRRTLVYGRALGQLVPQLAWCHRYAFEAEVALRSGAFRLALASGAPILPATPPRRFDSRVEERFAHDFSRLAIGWDLIREPEPIAACGTLIFPDFLLVRRGANEERWLIEIVGFWTPEYLETRLRRPRQAAVPNLLVCIDDSLNCGHDDFPAGAAVLRYRNRVDVRAVLARLEGDRG